MKKSARIEKIIAWIKENFELIEASECVKLMIAIKGNDVRGKVTNIVGSKK